MVSDFSFRNMHRSLCVVKKKDRIPLCLVGDLWENGRGADGKACKGDEKGWNSRTSVREGLWRVACA